MTRSVSHAGLICAERANATRTGARESQVA